jgi:hypothetical protein
VVRAFALAHWRPRVQSLVLVRKKIYAYVQDKSTYICKRQMCSDLFNSLIMEQARSKSWFKREFEAQKHAKISLLKKKNS